MTPRTHTPRRIACLCAAVVVAAAVLAACGDDTAQESDSPGRLFQGTYTMTTVDRLPSTSSDPTTSTWTVQSSCTGPDNGCVAVAKATTPGSGGDRMDFVYEKGSWSRIVVPDERPCVPAGLTTGVEEPWVAIDSTTLAASGPAGDLPIVTLTGSITSIQGGSCSGTSQKAITFVRTGNLPSGVGALSGVTYPKAASPVAAGFVGTYEQKTTVVSADPPTLVAQPPATQTSQITATPTCTRDGEHCLVVMHDLPAQPGETVAGYSNSGFDQTATLAERQCPGRPERYRPTLTSRTTIAPDASTPIGSMDSESTLTWSGACAGTVKFDSTLTRLGD